MIGEQVVLDTGTPIVYLGTLQEVTDRTFVLTQADIVIASVGLRYDEFPKSM